jgi:hypothetical protein
VTGSEKVHSSTHPTKGEIQILFEKRIRTIRRVAPSLNQKRVIEINNIHAVESKNSVDFRCIGL